MTNTIEVTIYCEECGDERRVKSTYEGDGYADENNKLNITTQAPRGWFVEPNGRTILCTTCKREAFGE